MSRMKEKETINREMEKRALGEVEGYIEKMRRGEEKKGGKKVMVEERKEESVERVKMRDDQGGVVLQDQWGSKGNMVLPLDEEEIKKKSGYGVGEAMRWLIESCVYLIRKYPGRVFYKSNTKKDE